AELSGPQLVAGGVVLPHERIGEPEAGLARQGWSAGGHPGHVDAGAVRRDAEGSLRAEGAELAGPEFVAGGVVLAHERIVAAGAALTRQRPVGVSADVDARGVRGHAGGKIVAGGAELPGPEFGPR